MIPEKWETNQKKPMTALAYSLQASRLWHRSLSWKDGAKTAGRPRWLEFLRQSAAAAKSLQSCLTLCDSRDGNPPGSPIPGILQARTLEWVAISFSNVWKWKWSCSVVSDSSRPHGLQPTRLLHPWDFPGKSAGVGCHCLLLKQAIITQNIPV